MEGGNQMKYLLLTFVAFALIEQDHFIAGSIVFIYCMYNLLKLQANEH